MSGRPVLRASAVLAALLLAASACSSSSRPGAAAGTTSTTSPPAAAAGAAGAPVQTVATSDGTVGFRRVGSGPPLVMIMGFGGSIDAWAPSFTDALASHYEVITPDNAGVGLTSALPSPLTMTAMANQVSAFITALHLGRPDVLGWSMGGMIAQALTVLHPSQVAKLVLDATLPGDGKAVLPSSQVIGELTHPSDPTATLSHLFPAGAAGQAASATYVAGILSYPNSYEAPAAAITAQTGALGSWALGTEAAGKGLASIAVPTLVADGSVDPLIPEANDAYLAATIPGAQLVIYTGASHAFMFQDQSSYLPRLLSFLG